MKTALISLVLLAVASTAAAAEIVEAIVIRVGDRVITRTQYFKRMRDGLAEIDQTVQAAEIRTHACRYGSATARHSSHEQGLRARTARPRRIDRQRTSRTLRSREGTLPASRACAAARDRHPQAG